MKEESIRDPKGLQVIEALAPQLTRFKCETKTDWFTLYWAERKLLAWYESILYRTLMERYETFFLQKL